MSSPNVFKTPDAHGSAIHPILLGFYYSLPSLTKAISDSKTDDKTLSHAIKHAWGTLSTGNGSAQAVWDLIGADKLIPADSAELLCQMCDLLDAELANVAEHSLGISTKIVIHSGAKVREDKPSSSYLLGLSIPLNGSISGTNLSSLLAHNFKTETIDYMFPDDIEPVPSEKSHLIASQFKDCIVVQLQRYRFDFGTKSNSKIYDRVEFPVQMSGEEFAKYADSASASAISACSLDLVAVLTHSDEKGYGLLVRPNASGPWFKCCDSELESPQETSVESAFGGDIDGDVAYMLFYKVTGGSGGLGGMARKMSRLSLKAAGQATAAASSGGGGCCRLS